MLLGALFTIVNIAEMSKPMKAEIYNAIAALNRGFDMTIESLKILQEEGIVDAEYVQYKTEISEEVRAGINQMILSNLESREEEDRNHFGKMRLNTEARLKGNITPA
jgi:hypothetical protein